MLKARIVDVVGGPHCRSMFKLTDGVTEFEMYFRAELSNEDVFLLKGLIGRELVGLDIRGLISIEGQLIMMRYGFTELVLAKNWRDTVQLVAGSKQSNLLGHV